MPEISIVTLERTASTASESAVEKLRGALKGELLLPSDGAYEAVRHVWNGNIDRRPALIARCTSAADVQAALEFARATDVLVAVRGGGHNAAGNGTCEGGLLIDLSLMKAIEVDAAGRTARAQPGVNWGELDVATQAHGLATTGGTVTNTGIAGLTLGGGVGWLMGKHGLTVDNLRGVEIVTAEGEVLQVNAQSHPDLFWAVRGGGGNFGVVTSFEYDLHPVGPQVLGGLVIHLLEQAGPVLRFYREFSRGLPDEAEAFAAVLTAPNGPPVVALILGYNGDLEEGARVLAPARAFGTPIQDTVGPMAYVERQGMIDEPNAVVGLQRYWKSGLSPDLNDALIDAIVSNGGEYSSPLSATLMVYIHGAATRVPAEATAFGARAAQWDVNVVGQWVEAGESAHHIEHTRAAWARMEPHLSPATYLNHLAGDDSAARVRASYGPSLERLAAIKAKYDPSNRFRLNANIAPQA